MKHTLKVMVSISFLTLFMGACSHMGVPDNYTATLNVAGMKMPIARLGKNMRTGNPVMKDVVIISLGEEGKTITLSTQKKKYFEEKSKDTSPNIFDARTTIEKKHLTSEKIGDHPCEVYDATFYLPNHPDDKRQAKIWEAQDLNQLVIRVDIPSPDGSGTVLTTELQDIVLGNAKPDMFTIPADYMKADDINEVMGMPVLNDLKKGFKGLLNKMKNN
jgi:hypothetical protein